LFFVIFNTNLGECQMKNYFLKSFLMLFFVLSTTNIQASGFLMFPILGYTKSTAPVTAIFDHDRNTNSIKTFKGEVGSYKDGCLAYINGSNTTCSSSTKIRAYKRPSGLAWTVTGINYIDAAPGTNIYMWYDNHNGYDYAVPDMTPVVAAASGTGEITDKDLKWGQIKINHGNGYRTIYTHMRLNMPLPKIIKKGVQ
jgi:hypothetical protein